MNSNGEKERRIFRILSIDGGGIRGIIPAAILLEVERAIRRHKSGAAVKIGECFDMIATTSTGGILTCMLLFPDKDRPDRARFSAADTLRLYMENGDDIFERSIWQMIVSSGGLSNEKYSAYTLESILSYYFDDVKISRLIRPCLITACDAEKYQPFFFSRHDARETPAGEFLAQDSAQTAFPVPTCFDAALPGNRDRDPNAGPLINGGVLVNNPAAYALVEALGLRARNPVRFSEIVILSLGTGPRREIAAYGHCCDWGLAGWVGPLIQIIMEGVSQTVDYQLKMVFDSIGKKNQYLRIDGTFGDCDIEDFDPAMDNADPENMKRLERFGRRLAERHRDAIQAFVEAYF